jgi:hypothetical protein
MNKNFADMKTNVGLELQDTSTAFSTLIGKWINRRYFQVLRSVNWGAINSDYTLSIVSGTQDYVLPSDFKAPVYVIDSTNNITYSEVRFDGFSETSADITEQTGERSYCIFDVLVNQQPTAASAVTVVSSSASDTATTVTIRGTVAGVEDIETLTLNGVSNVTGTKSFSYIKTISKDATVGYITVTCNSQTVAIVSSETKVYKAKKIRFFGIPASSFTISIPYHILPLPLSNNNDIPIIDIDDCLEAGARADGWKYKRQGQKAGVEENNFQMLLSDYQWNLENNPNLSNQFNPQAYSRDIY